MKKIYSVVIFVLLFVLTTTTVKATSFFDDFDDGDTDGWDFSQTLGLPLNIGNWRVEGGTLAQDSGFDGVVALLESFQITDQTVETDLKLNGPSGGAELPFGFRVTTH